MKRDTATSKGMPPPALTDALSGIRVLDFGRVIAAPRCARYLAELGADVIHIEHPNGGDLTRNDRYPLDEGLSGAFVLENWGKRSLAIDLGHPAAREILIPLVASSDVVIENFRPGTMARFGLSYEQLCDIRPNLIMCSISAFGQKGPEAAYAGYGFITDALAGLVGVPEDAKDAPTPTSIPISDVVAAPMAFGLITSALLRREREGQGSYIDLALLDAAFAAHDLDLQIHLSSRGSAHKPFSGLRDLNDRVPWGYFQGRDGWLLIMCGTDSQWQGLASLLGCKERSWRHQAGRRQGCLAIYQLIEDWVKQFTHIDEALVLLKQAKVPCGRLNSPGQAAEMAQTQIRNLIATVHQPDVGDIQIQNFLGPNADSPSLRPAPQLGEHTREIAIELGIPSRQIDILMAQGCLRE